MYEPVEFWLNHIQCLEPGADSGQMKAAAVSLSRCNGKEPADILKSLYSDLLMGIPLSLTTAGKVIGYMFT